MKEIKINKTILPNGLRVISSQREGELFSMGAVIMVGSMYEDINNNGISHFLEHMLFKGTMSRSLEGLSNDIEKLAGDFDIYTSYDHTVMTIDTLNKHSENSIELFADMFMNASLPKKDFMLEKKVIIEEIKMAKDDPEDFSYLSLLKKAYPDNFHWFNIAGNIKNVRSIKHNQLQDFYKTFYIPENTSICITSSYSHSEVLTLIEKYFGSWKAGKKTPIEEVFLPFKNGSATSYRKGLGQVHVMYGFDIQSLNKKEEVILALINEKIGGGANSYLFRELRDNRGYAYSLYSDMDYIKNLKMFYIYAGISKENLKGTLEVIDDIIKKLKSNDLRIEEDNLELLKEIYYTNTTISLESSSSVVSYMINGEINAGNPEDYKEAFSIIKACTIEDVRQVIQKVFTEPLIHILMPRE